MLAAWRATTAFAVLAEPNRRRILDRLLVGEQPVGALVEMLSVSQPAVSKHLQVLRVAGLVESRTDAERRFTGYAPNRSASWTSGSARIVKRWSVHLDDLERHLDDMPTARSQRPGGVNMSENDVPENGTLEAAGDRWRRWRFTRRLADSPEKVWRDTTEPEHLKAWFPDKIEGTFAPGGVILLRVGVPTELALRGRGHRVRAAVGARVPLGHERDAALRDPARR